MFSYWVDFAWADEESVARIAGRLPEWKALLSLNFNKSSLRQDLMSVNLDNNIDSYSLQIDTETPIVLTMVDSSY